MEHNAKRTLLQVLVSMVIFGSVVSQLTIDGKVYDCELPTGCPANTQLYLEQFGYLNPMRDCIKEDIEAALRKFQELNIDFMGLQVTGECDNITKVVMQQPRCGCEDIVKFEKKMMPSNFIGPQEFNTGNTRWPKSELTWIVTKYPQTPQNRRLTREEVDGAMRRGLDIWAKETTLTFRQVTSLPADINIRFETRRHTTNPPYYDFDGPGSVLAHAFFPTSGLVHFDDDETYVLNSNQGVELFIVAAHEFGHTLGISHSNVNSALMAPYYRYSSNLVLDRDDILAVQSLYGKSNKNTQAPVTLRPPTNAPTLSPTNGPTLSPTDGPTLTPRPEYCNLQIRAAFKMYQTTYIFTRERVSRFRTKTFIYKVTDNGLDKDSRQPIEAMFKKADSRRYPRAYPYRVDAAAYIPNRQQIYLFSGTRTYRYSSAQDGTFTLDTNSRYPRWMDVSEFPERPRAAIVLPYTNYNDYYMLIFGQTMVWDWNLVRERVGAWAYPINAFGRNMPQRVDGAIFDLTDVLFFKGDNFYKFDVRRRRIVDETVYSVAKDFFKGDCA